MKQDRKQMIPVLLVIGVTLVMSLLLYYSAMNLEKEKCWQLLEDSAQAVSREIQIKFEDSIAALRLVANVVRQEKSFEPEQIEKLQLEDFRQSTVFTRIDVIYPQGTILLEDGTQTGLQEDISFAELAAAGEHMSARRMDAIAESESVYYYIPVEKEGQIQLILAGVIDSVLLKEHFQATIYNGQANCCIVDSRDGNFIMDEWHPELGNAYDTPDRKRLKGYEHLDLKEELRNLRTGVIAFISRTNGLDLYMYYTPLDMFDWQLVIFTQEDTVFESLLHLKNLLLLAGMVEAVLLCIYFFWNVHGIRQLKKSKAEAEWQLTISNTLIRCVTELSSDKDINVSIENLLKIIAEYFGADSAHIFEYDAQEDVFLNMYEYAQDTERPRLPLRHKFSSTLLVEGMEAFVTSQVYYIADRELQKPAYTYEILKKWGVQSLLAVPLKKEDHVIGFVSVDNPKKCYEDVTLLSSIQFFISNSLSVKKQQEELQFMSYRDGLTALYNRNKYNQVLEEQKQKHRKRIGVAYLDLNGLKLVNDLQGHEKGDNLICRTAKSIAGIFPGKAYRIGGDEFVILSPDTEEKVFFTNIEMLRQHMAQEQISISLGALWEENCEDLEKLLKAADGCMYEEKMRYHQNL